MTTNTAIVAALLAVALISIAWLWVKYVERNTHRTDDPLMQSKRWNQRKRLNQCIFCGHPLDGDFDPDRLLLKKLAGNRLTNFAFSYSLIRPNLSVDPEIFDAAAGLHGGYQPSWLPAASRPGFAGFGIAILRRDLWIFSPRFPIVQRFDRSRAMVQKRETFFQLPLLIEKTRRQNRAEFLVERPKLIQRHRIQVILLLKHSPASPPQIYNRPKHTIRYKTARGQRAALAKTLIPSSLYVGFGDSADQPPRKLRPYFNSQQKPRALNFSNT
jgi:hypothetical protein